MDWSHKEPLRVLFLASNPADTGKLELEKEYQKVEAARQALIAAGPVNLVRHNDVKLDDLIPLVTQFRPHLLHFAGHGDLLRPTDAPPQRGRWRGLHILDDNGQPLDPTPDESPPGGILLPDDKGRARRLSDEVLIRLCKVKEIREHLRLVLLNACWAAGQAEKIVNEAEIPFAIGMNQPIDDAAAIRFATGFYHALFNPAYSLLSAFDIGCNQIQTQSRAGQENVPRLFGDENRAQALKLFVELPIAALADLPTDTLPARAPLPAPTNMGEMQPNEAFVGREEEMKNIARALKVNARAAVAAGIGGAGKTQLAVEWAHRYGQYFPGGVFWLDFSVDEKKSDEDKSDDERSYAPSSIRAAGRHYAIRGYDAETPEEQIRLTREQWARTTALLIFDNCESQSLAQQYLPAPGGARVLLTSRDQTWDNPTTSIKQIEVATLPREKSIELLQRLYPALSNEHAAAIAAELGYLPLALHIAGSVLALDGDPAAYLEELRDPALLEILADHATYVKGAPFRHDDYNVRVAFGLSIRRLDDDSHDHNALARELLLLLAHFAPGTPVPDEWLIRALPEGTKPRDAKAAIRRLIAVGLAERAGDDTLRMHRLVALATLHDADADARARAETQSETIILEVRPEYGTAAFNALMDAWQPHARHIVARALPRRDEQATLLANAIGSQLEKFTLYKDAKFFYEADLEISREVMGNHHPETAQSLNNLASLHQVQGDYERAMLLYEEALAIQRKMPGNLHPDTAQTLNNLAELYRLQGEYVLALPLCIQALSIRRIVLGNQHPDTAQSLNNLALLYHAKGDYGRAQSLYEESLEIKRSILGILHPSIATGIHNLASLYNTKGDYERAQLLYEEALDINCRVLGESHPDTAANLNALALVYYAQGDYARALPQFEKALAIQRDVLGDHHPSTAATLNNLASLYYKQGENPRALSLFQEVLSIRREVLGSHHPDTAQSLSNLAGLYQEMNKYRDALLLYEEALEIMRETLGRNHPDTAICLNNVATLYYQQGDYERTAVLLEEALAITRKVLGPYHPNTADLVNNLATLYHQQREYKRSMPLLEEALAIQRKMLGNRHPDIALSLNDLAVEYCAQRQYGRALPLLEEALSIRRKILGSRHPHTAVSLSNLAVLHGRQKEHERALPLLEEALSITREVLGSRHADTALCLNDLAELYKAQGKYERALPLFDEAVSIMEEQFGRYHPETILILTERDICRAALEQS